jgi:hypothetical protein
MVNGQRSGSGQCGHRGVGCQKTTRRTEKNITGWGVVDSTVRQTPLMAHKTLARHAHKEDLLAPILHLHAHQWFRQGAWESDGSSRDSRLTSPISTHGCRRHLFFGQREKCRCHTFRAISTRSAAIGQSQHGDRGGGESSFQTPSPKTSNFEAGPAPCPSPRLDTSISIIKNGPRGVGWLVRGGLPNFYVTFMFGVRSAWEWARWIPLIERSPNPPSDPSHTQCILQGCGG